MLSVNHFNLSPVVNDNEFYVHMDGLQFHVSIQLILYRSQKCAVGTLFPVSSLMGFL